MMIVVKVGGSLAKEGIPGALHDDIKVLSATNRVVLVHGGADLVTAIAEKLGKKQTFITSPAGIRSRYTDRETAEIFTMVMSGLVAKKILFGLAARGLKGVTLSGLDGGLMNGKRKKKLVVVDDRDRKMAIDGGFTGKVDMVDPRLLELLVNNGYIPIVSPIAMSEENEPLNIDGDRAAAAVASGIHADSIFFLTDVDGLILDGRVVERLTSAEAREKLPLIGPGMQKKVMAAVEAVDGGAKEAVICSGLRQNPLQEAAAHNNCTVIAG